MKTIRQIIGEQIELAYKHGKINLSESWAVINAADAKELFRSVLRVSTQDQRDLLIPDYPTTDTQVEFVQRQVEKAWADLCALRDETSHGRHVDNRIAEARENSL